jgi:hypothetical protein
MSGGSPTRRRPKEKVMQRITRAFTAGAVATGLLLAGCGDDDDDLDNVDAPSVTDGEDSIEDTVDEGVDEVEDTVDEGVDEVEDTLDGDG